MRYSYTESVLREAARKSISFRQMIIALGMNEGGGNFTTLKKRVLELGIDISHFKGRGWNLGGRSRNSYKPEDVLKRDTDFKSYLVKKKFIEHCKVEEKCSQCGLSEWNGSGLVMELDHIDGDRRNNEVENLRLLCPNCHSQTPGWRNRKLCPDTPTEEGHG